MPDTTSPWQPPRDGSEARIAVIWAGILGHNRFGIRDSFFDVGGDSLQAVTMMGQIEKAFAQPVAISWLARDASIAGLAERLQAASDWDFECLIPLAPAGPPPPLYLFHTNHGDLAGYRHLVNALRGRLAVHGFEPRGIDGRSEVRRSVPAMAADYVRELTRFQPAGPFVLLGFSFGGLIAFEAACVLERMGRAPSSLVLVDPLMGGAVEAHRVRRRQGLLGSQRWTERARMFGHLLRRRLRRQTLHGVARLYQRRGRPVPARVRKSFFITLGASATRTYQPPVYRGNALLFCARDDVVTPVWEPLVEGQLDRVDHDHEHRGMLTAAGAPAVADELVRRYAPGAL